MIRSIIPILFLLSRFNTSAQDENAIKFIPMAPPGLSLLELRLIDGDEAALQDIAQYLDDRSVVTEMLGYHILQTTPAQIAQRLLQESSEFLPEELLIDSTLTANRFKDFLISRKHEIVFSELANAFLIKPLDERVVKVDFRGVPPIKMQELKSRKDILLAPQWVSFSQADSLIAIHDSKALLIIASELHKKRNRFDTYYHQREEFTNLLEYLTGTQIMVENDADKMTWHVAEEYGPKASLNLLVYFCKHYKEYVWNTEKQLFVREGIIVAPATAEEALFAQLASKNDSVAMQAFIKLTTADPKKVEKLAAEFNAARLDINYSLPTFPFKFLPQLTRFTHYCNNNNIGYEGSLYLRQQIEKLKGEQGFKERRKLEDKLIEELTLEDISAFEYWSLINEKSWDLTYSAGRILDKFYSKNWNLLLANEKHLDWYLKKSELFDNLGIIGICNDYIVKFRGVSPAILSNLAAEKHADADIARAAENAVKIQVKVYKFAPLVEMDTIQYNMPGLVLKLRKLFTGWNENDENKDTLSYLQSKINFSQIGEMLTAMDTVTFKDMYDAYNFLTRDFGFFMVDVQDKSSISLFLHNYNKMNEEGLYRYYLDKAGIDYKRMFGGLDYDKIYELLKYDVNEAFVGGGGGALDNEVYSLIKLLEIKFSTTLGFSNKLCSSDNIWACYSSDRVRAWMSFLEENHLLKKPHREPLSFHAFKH